MIPDLTVGISVTLVLKETSAQEMRCNFVNTVAGLDEGGRVVKQEGCKQAQQLSEMFASVLEIWELGHI